MATIDDTLAAKKAALDRWRPVSAKGLAALAAWYDVELTYTSNAIEGSTLTRIETAIVLEKGITVAGKPLRDHVEAVGHKDALDHIRQVAAAGASIRENDVRQIHALVMGRSDPQGAGRYSDHQRLISGTSYVPPRRRRSGRSWTVSGNGCRTRRPRRRRPSRRTGAWR